MRNTVLIISNVSAGLFNFRRELLEQLVKQFKVIVIAEDNGKKDEIEKIGCSFIPVKVDRHGTNPIKEITLIHSYSKYIREIKPFVVLTYTIKPNIYAGIACRNLHVPCIANITGLGDAIENDGIVSSIAKRMYSVGLKEACFVYFQNRSNADFFISKKIFSGRYDILPGSGVNISRNPYEPYPAENKAMPIVLCVVGRITKDKGISEIIEASYQFDPKILQIQLIGNCENDYIEQIRKAEEHGVIHYVGRQENVHEWLKASHAILHASYHEGMSNVLLEAASCGRPIIATNIPGCKEAFDDHLSGIGFEPRSCTEIVNAINRFLAIPYEQRIEMGKIGRKKMETEFDRNIVVNKYLNCIESVLKA